MYQVLIHLFNFVHERIKLYKIIYSDNYVEWILSGDDNKNQDLIQSSQSSGKRHHAVTQQAI